MPKKGPTKYRRGKAVRPPKQAEVKYRKALLKLIHEINEAIKAQVLPIVRENKNATLTTDTRVQDGYIGDIAQAFAVIQTLLKLDEGASKAISASFVGMVGKNAAMRVDETIERAGFQLPTIQNVVEREAIGNALDAFAMENADLVTNLGEEYLRKIQRAVTDNFLTGKFIGKGGLEKELNRISGVTKTRAKLIARDQTSKINSAMTRVRATNAGSIGYQWHNVRDARVRGNPAGKYPNVPKTKNHWDREGKYYLWEPMTNPPKAPNGKPFKQPPVDGAPGEAINCRCYSTPVWAEEDGTFVGV